MKLIDNINYNTYLTYKQPDTLEPNRKIKSENFEWDSNHPKSLETICIEKLSEKWSGEFAYN